MILIGLSVYTRKTKYMKVGRQRAMNANYHFTVGVIRMKKYFGSLLTNQNSVHEEIKCRFKLNLWLTAPKGATPVN